MQEFFYVVLSSIVSIIVMFLLTKMMGYRQLSELSMFDYVVGITIGSIAAEMATSLDKNMIYPITAMFIYGIFSVILSYISCKSMRLRNYISGKPLVLIDEGEIYQDNLKKSKIDLSELLVQCRNNGYFDVSKIKTAVLEGNGKISFLPKETERPLTPADIGLKPKADFLVANIIIDGNIMVDNLAASGKDEAWLTKKLAANNVKKVEDVLLATCDIDNNFTVFLKNHDDGNKASELIN